MRLLGTIGFKICCNVMQFVGVECVLRCVAVCCNVLLLKCVVECGCLKPSVLKSVAVCCSVLVLICVAMCCSWQCVAVCCNVLQRDEICCRVLLLETIGLEICCNVM